MEYTCTEDMSIMMLEIEEQGHFTVAKTNYLSTHEDHFLSCSPSLLRAAIVHKPNIPEAPIRHVQAAATKNMSCTQGNQALPFHEPKKQKKKKKIRGYQNT